MPALSALPRTLASVAILAVVSVLASCRTTSDTRNPQALEAKAEDQILCGDPNGALNSFRLMAGSSTRPEDRARAQLGIARCHLRLGNPRQSLDTLYGARSLCDIGPLRERLDRLFAEAAFQNRDYRLARGYLEKSLPAAEGSEKIRILAELHICSVKTGDSKAAQRYLADLPRPQSLEIRDLLREHLEDSIRAPVKTQPSMVKPTRPAPSPEPDVEIPPTGPLKVIPRTYWGASPVLVSRSEPMGRIIRLTIHHEGGPTFWGKSSSESALEIRKIQRYHQRENHWADIGYHYVIDRVGRVWQGRPLFYQGAHAHGDANRGNIGIVVLGNYTQQQLNTAQVRTLRSLVLRLCQEYSIAPGRVYTHSEIRRGTTECPGPALTRVVENLRRSFPATSLGN